jgi:predicted DNA-binding WGR domain protein
MPQYICKEHVDRGKATNAFWSYELVGNTGLQIKFGRLGLAGQSKDFTFDSSSTRNEYLSKKLREKQQHGYKLATQEEVHKEEDTARALGVQYKIDRLLWVSKHRDGVLKTLPSYDPAHYVYVEILNSWSKEVTKLLLSKTNHFQLNDAIRTGSTITFKYSSSAPSNFAEAVRIYLKDLAKKVTQIVVQFASLGVRILDLGEDNSESPMTDTRPIDELYKKVGESTVSRQVISRFAGLGMRILDI